MTMKAVCITKEALAENPDVIFEAMSRLARHADYRNPGPVIVTRCTGPNSPEHPLGVISDNEEKGLIHLQQEAFR